MSYPFEAAVFAERNRNRVYEIVVKMIEEAARKNGVKRKDIAAKIGRSEPQVSGWLKGPSNWTLDTVSDLLWSIDAEMDYEGVFHSDRAIQNTYNESKVPKERARGAMIQEISGDYEVQVAVHG